MIRRALYRASSSVVFPTATMRSLSTAIALPRISLRCSSIVTNQSASTMRRSITVDAGGFVGSDSISGVNVFSQRFAKASSVPNLPLPLFSKDGNGKRSSFDHFLALLHFLLKPVVEDIGQSEFFLYRSRFEHLLEHHLHAFFRHVPVVGKRFYICVVGFRSRLLIKTQAFAQRLDSGQAVRLKTRKAL